MRIDKKNRKSFKKAAIANIKRHYWLFVVMCFLGVMIGAEFSTTDYLASARTGAFSEIVNQDPQIETIEDEIVKAREENFDNSVFMQSVYEGILNREYENENLNLMFSRSKGTLNAVIDYVTSGTIVSNISSMVLILVGTPSAANIVMTVITVLVTGGFWLLVSNLYKSVVRRIALEGRIYNKIPFGRFMFFIKVRRWFNTAFGMALYSICIYASLATVIGYPIVYYGLILMPYIIAENPDIRPVDALKLSWKMMKGNKFNAFKISLSLMGWNILGTLTVGLLNIFFLNPYRITIYSEVYATLRDDYLKNNPSDEVLLNDKYLFSKPDLQALKMAYHEVDIALAAPEYKLQGLTGAKKFFANTFGVVLWNTPDELAYEDNQAKRQSTMNLKDELEGLSYPTRLGPISESRHRRSLSNIHYMRHYSLLSLISMFFIYSVFGWTWEVFYYYILQGHFINRGVLHGPWLPIYGVGGVLILACLFKLRKNPGKHFIGTIVLCGALEYFGSVILELLFDAKWWDYSGFFLNLHGRICAEGLLVFGIAGLAFIYVLSPILDDLIRKINPKKLLPVAIILSVIFVGDLIYSRMVPNTGDGITDGFAGGERIEEVIETNGDIE